MCAKKNSLVIPLSYKRIKGVNSKWNFWACEYSGICSRRTEYIVTAKAVDHTVIMQAITYLTGKAWLCVLGFQISALLIHFVNTACIYTCLQLWDSLYVVYLDISPNLPVGMWVGDFSTWSACNVVGGTMWQSGAATSICLFSDCCPFNRLWYGLYGLSLLHRPPLWFPAQAFSFVSYTWCLKWFSGHFFLLFQHKLLKSVEAKIIRVNAWSGSRIKKSNLSLLTNLCCDWL